MLSYRLVNAPREQTVDVYLLMTLFILLVFYWCQRRKRVEGFVQEQDLPISVEQLKKMRIERANNLADLKDQKLAEESSREFQKLMLHNNRCSVKCCSPQWPVPFQVGDPNDTHDYSKYVPSPYFCQSDKESGCVCMTQRQHDYLGSRGRNGFNGFVNGYKYWNDYFNRKTIDPKYCANNKN